MTKIVAVFHGKKVIFTYPKDLSKEEFYSELKVANHRAKMLP